MKLKHCIKYYNCVSVPQQHGVVGGRRHWRQDRLEGEAGLWHIELSGPIGWHSFFFFLHVPVGHLYVFFEKQICLVRSFAHF